MRTSPRFLARITLGVAAWALVSGAPAAQAPSTAANAAVHAKQVKRLLITNAMVIPGPAVPASGPIDILLEDGLIARMGSRTAGRWPAADMVIDATGKYVMPGIVNTHMHWHEERVGPIPIQYERNLYLAAGVTTAREVGGDFEKTKQWRADSAAHKIIAPRIVHYPMLRDLLKPGETFNGSPAEHRALVRAAKERGADGIKLIGPMDRDDLIRAQNLPWYKELLHPSLEEYYKPSMTRHGTFWTGWTATQEVRWRKNYQVWMAALREFGLKGGTITTGDDAGYLYGSLYGFGISRELELHEEAGFHPLEVIKHATSDGAKVIGMADRLGRVRVGYMADLLVVNGNPLENLRVMNPYGTDVMSYNGQIINNYSGIVKPGDANVKSVHGGGIEWTIKDGIPYHVPALVKEVKELVAKGRAERTRTTSPQQ